MKHRIAVYTGTIVASLLLVAMEGRSVEKFPWVTVRETADGITVKARETPGSNIRAVLATMEVAASPKTVIDVAGDPKTFNKTDKYLDDYRIYRKAGANVWHIYYLVNFPFVARRDYTLRYERTVVPAKNLYKLSWRAASEVGPPPSEDVIRVDLADGWVEATSLKNDTSSSVSYYVLADPGGHIPAWVMNIANKSTVPEILRQIRDAALRRAHAAAFLDQATETMSTRP